MGSQELVQHRPKETETHRLRRLRTIGKATLAQHDTDMLVLQSADFPQHPEQEARLRLIDGSLIEKSSPLQGSDICLQYFPSPQDVPEQNTRYLFVGFAETPEGVQIRSRRIVNQVDKDLALPATDAPTTNDLDEIELMLLDPTCQIIEKNPAFSEIAAQKRINRERLREERLTFYGRKVLEVVRKRSETLSKR